MVMDGKVKRRGKKVNKRQQAERQGVIVRGSNRNLPALSYSSVYVCGCLLVAVVVSPLKRAFRRLQFPFVWAVPSDNTRHGDGVVKKGQKVGYFCQRTREKIIKRYGLAEKQN